MGEQHADTPLGVADLAGVVYSSGKVFDGLSTGRLDTVEFLRTGTTRGVTSRFDLALLEDLRDVSQFIIDHARAHLPLDAEFLRAINRSISRSGALNPGGLRRDDQHIGVTTTYGRHEPPALDEAQLNALITRSISTDDAAGNAISLFVALAKAQPFEDGNKRTALFAANALLIDAGTDMLLTIPVDDDDPVVARQFNDKLARAYVQGDDQAVTAMLREHGLKPLATATPHDAADAKDDHAAPERLMRLPGLAERVDLRPPTGQPTPLTHRPPSGGDLHQGHTHH